ncbi:MAG: competence/damage-inducible protein A, partial [Nitrospinae bacterium]|nr:competence/damage-inducible protein A [Nitrospinota bacterium]
MKTQKFKRAWIVTIGNELTTGLVADINASVSARFLLKRGYDVARIVSVPDTERAITSVVGEALRKSDFVIITGGLGPTHDDVTKNALCKFFKCKTRFNPSVLRQVQGMFKKFGKKTPGINRSYADVPTAAIAVRNGAGIAPGLLFKNRVLVLPGVPHEARHMLETSALRLVPFGGMHAADKIFRTAGASETRLSDGMKGLSSALKIVEVAFLPSLGNVDVRIISRD